VNPEVRVESFKQQVLEKCAYFIDVQLWPLRDVLAPHQWLSNFDDQELPYALYLLDSFVHFSERAVDSLLVAGVQQLSRLMKGTRPTLSTAQANWLWFLDRVIVTYVTGENPNVTDSGYTFARKVRQLLAVPEERILAPEDALAHVLKNPGPVLFVDDFVGSGSQCIYTWHREYDINGTLQSFANASNVGALRGGAFYCPLICTTVGSEAIRKHCAGLDVQPTHLIGPEYSAISSESVLWPSRLKPGARAFVESVSRRAGLPDTNGKSVDDWQGFHCLGLAISFYHSVPDATLPIFYHDKNNWRPLIRRA
jgi:hypothetical protein